jgi:plastocyanin
MVRIAPLLSAVALFSSLASGLPSMKRRQDDSAIGDQVGVSAPDGIPISNSIELASQRARESGLPPPQTQTQTAAKTVMTPAGHGGNYGAQMEKVNMPAAPPAHQTTTMVHQTSSSAAHQMTTSSAAHTTSTSAVEHKAATTTQHTSSALPTHGSGSANWSSNNPEYDACVQQCVATHGGPAAEYKPTATKVESAGSTGTGATHTVIVAPTQGVLRYIPFAVNATVGDTIKFMWGANNHTVTKGSALLPCNRTADAVFASGVQNKDFEFTQVVNDTTPLYFFCGTPGHCQKGMFGIVNPTTNFAAATSVSSRMQSIAANNSVVGGYAAYTAKQTEGNARAARWGGNIDMSQVPDWAAASVVENVLFTRNFLAKNPETLKDDGSIDLSSAGTTPLVIPQDIAAALAGTPASTAAPAGNTAPAPATPPATQETTTPPPNAAGLSNSAMSGNSPRLLVAAMAVLATFMIL